MKHYMFFCLMLAISAAPLSGQIPNSGFESWYNDSNGNLNPVGWETMNDTPTISCDQYTPAYAGNYSMRVRPVDFGAVVPGIAILDFKYNQKPTKLTGFVKSTIMSNDMAMIYLMFYNQDSIIASPAQCTFKLDTSYSTFTQFTLPISYMSSKTPDSATLVVIAGDFTNPKAGTEIILDNLLFEFGSTSSVEKPDNLGVTANLYPNPAKNSVSVNLNSHESSPVQVFITDMLGRLLLTHDAGTISKGTGNFNLNTETLESGMYLVLIKTTGGNIQSVLQILK